MALLNETFSAADAAPEQDFSPLPAGEYQAIVTATELKNTKNGTGQYIQVTYEIAGPTHTGRLVWQNFNIRNANPKAAEIGRQQLGSLIKASGLQGVSDTDQLITGNMVSLKLAIRKSTEYGDSNDVKAIKAVSTTPVPTIPQVQPIQQGAIPVTPQPVQQTPVAQAPPAAPPWA